MLKFASGAHSGDNFIETFLTPLFAKGVIPEYLGADYYAIAYGELGAYRTDGVLLATWSAMMPDCESDVWSENNYAGEWVLDITV